MKLKIVSLLITLIGVSYSSVVMGQCTGPYCSPSRPGNYGGVYPSYPGGYGGVQPSYPDNYGSPYINPDQFSVSEEVLQQIRKASVIVENAISVRMTAKGSGTIVKYNESVFVITAGHVVQSASEVTVSSEYIGRVRCRVVTSDTTTDFAVLEPLERQEELYTLATNWYTPQEERVVRTNIPVVLAGFDGTTRIRVWKSVFHRYTQTTGSQYANWMIIGGAARSGDSGGGVFNTKGELIGIIWGTDSQTTIATWIAPVQETCLRPGLFRWRRPVRPPPGPVIPNPGPRNPEPGDTSPAPIPPSDKPPDVKPPEQKPEPPAPPKEEPKKPETKPEESQQESWLDAIAQVLGPSFYVIIAFVTFLFTITLSRLFVFFKLGR